ncbi:ELF3-like protein 2 [Cucurbita pepo subsp. pepo]|uniref:ELF3-like protein 2 n=1 Tax=Cucurbita pepo subsp. pepo TaxID=3664 RepID=UPI000C9D58C9|nr:ELF3-like protein 2 [Cucurbita pepo subsp. pepo]
MELGSSGEFVSFGGFGERMRGGKDEQRLLLSPMFPRLHVNDTDKGGPRAPPRNKMALYEQLTIPAQKFSSGSASAAAPLPLGTPTTSTSSSHFGGKKRGIFSSSSKGSKQSHHDEKLHSYDSKGVVQSNEAKLLKTSVVAAGSLSSNPPSNSIAKVLNPQKFRERMSSGSTSELDTSRKYAGNEGEGHPNLGKATQDHVKRPIFIHSATDEPLLEPNTRPSMNYRDSQKAKLPHPSKQNWTSTSNSSTPCGANVRANPEGLAEQSSEALQDNVGCAEVRGLENSSPRDGDRNVANEFEKFATVRLREVEHKHNVSEASLVDSATAPNISPDVVVGLIGEKQFWKARKAISHQQRIFAVQVFELHRLIEVQRLIAGSPHILLEHYLDKPPSALSAVKNKPTKCAAQQPVRTATVKGYHQRPNPVFDTKCADKNPLAKLPLPSFNKDNTKLALTRQTSNEIRVKDTPQTPIAAVPKSAPWCISHPTPGNQWLVPVMSPSETLVYKPYTGPCPPTAGFVTPMYGNHGLTSLNTGSGDFYTPAYAVPASNHQGFGYFPGMIPLNQMYFPHYGVPVTNQSMSGSTPDQMSLFGKVKSKEQEKQISTGDINYLAHQENSCDMPSQTSHSMPFRARKVHGSMGSTGSSSSERGNGDVLPLFPTEPPGVEESSPNADMSEQKSRAIKVVPHHPKSATESAARIFQLIQEERNQL